MNRLVAALIIAPWAVWYGYRAVRAVRRGAFESLLDPIERASVPDLFWFSVARQTMLSALFTTLACAALLDVRAMVTFWIFGAFAAGYVVLPIVEAICLSRSGDAGVPRPDADAYLRWSRAAVGGRQSMTSAKATTLNSAESIQAAR